MAATFICFAFPTSRLSARETKGDHLPYTCTWGFGCIFILSFQILAHGHGSNLWKPSNLHRIPLIIDDFPPSSNFFFSLVQMLASSTIFTKHAANASDIVSLAYYWKLVENITKDLKGMVYLTISSSSLLSFSLFSFSIHFSCK